MLSDAKRALLTQFTPDGTDCEITARQLACRLSALRQGHCLRVAPKSMTVEGSITANSASSDASRDSISISDSP